MCSLHPAQSSQMQNKQKSLLPLLSLFPSQRILPTASHLGPSQVSAAASFSLSRDSNTGEIWGPEPPQLEYELPFLVKTVLLVFFQKCANCIMLRDRNDVNGRCFPFHVSLTAAGVKTTWFHYTRLGAGPSAEGCFPPLNIYLLISTILFNLFQNFLLPFNTQHAVSTQ